MIYYSFDEYVADYPEAERYREWLTGVASLSRRIHRKIDRKSTPRVVTIIPCDRSSACQLPGGYYWVRVSTFNGRSLVSVNDCDDGLMQKACDSEQSAMREVELLVELCPFTLSDLYDFGYNS